jgi:hypothetical protein
MHYRQEVQLFDRREARVKQFKERSGYVRTPLNSKISSKDTRIVDFVSSFVTIIESAHLGS